MKKWIFLWFAKKKLAILNTAILLTIDIPFSVFKELENVNLLLRLLELMESPWSLLKQAFRLFKKYSIRGGILAFRMVEEEDQEALQINVVVNESLNFCYMRECMRPIHLTTARAVTLGCLPVGLATCSEFVTMNSHENTVLYELIANSPNTQVTPSNGRRMTLPFSALLKQNRGVSHDSNSWEGNW